MRRDLRGGVVGPHVHHRAIVGEAAHARAQHDCAHQGRAAACGSTHM